MTRDEIIKMANKAGLYHFYDSEGQCTGITNARLVTQDKDRWDDRLVEMLAPFAALVRADERKAIEPIVYGLCISDNNAQEIVNAIRKRGQE